NHLENKKSRAADGAGIAAAAARKTRPRLLLRAAETGAARLSGAESGRDGRRHAPARHYPAYAGHKTLHGPACRQYRRGRRTMRHPGGAAALRAGKTRKTARPLGP